MAQLKPLTPAQRERATELMYDADAKEAEVVERVEEIVLVDLSTGAMTTLPGYEYLSELASGQK